MNDNSDLARFGADIVYVKAVAVDSLPEEIREKAGELTVLFSVHDTAGTPLALVGNRALAFALARQHDKVPVTVH
jgi:hypothetical protein